jgi:hypothetical protein
VFSGRTQGAELALDAADAEAARDADAVDVAERRAGALRVVSQSSDGTQRIDPASLAKPPARSASVTER